MENTLYGSTDILIQAVTNNPLLGITEKDNINYMKSSQYLLILNLLSTTVPIPPMGLKPISEKDNIDYMKSS